MYRSVTNISTESCYSFTVCSFFTYFDILNCSIYTRMSSVHNLYTFYLTLNGAMNIFFLNVRIIRASTVPWTFSWLCRKQNVMWLAWQYIVWSQHTWYATIVQCHMIITFKSHGINLIGTLEIRNAMSTASRNHSRYTRPFPSLMLGSRNKTTHLVTWKVHISHVGHMIAISAVLNVVRASASLGTQKDVAIVSKIKVPPHLAKYTPLPHWYFPRLGLQCGSCHHGDKPISWLPFQRVY